MAFATRLTPALAARWRGAGLWSDETFATALAALGARDARSRSAVRWQASIELPRARGRHRSHGRPLARARHWTRRRGHDPTAKLGGVCVRVLRLGTHRGGGGDRERGFPQPRARLHHALRRGQDAGLLRRVPRLRSPGHGAGAGGAASRSGADRGRARRAAGRCREPRRDGGGGRGAHRLRAGADRCRCGHAHGIHIGDHGQSQGRDAQPQHHARGRPHSQRRSRARARRRDADLAAARAQLGLSDPGAGRARRRQGGAARPVHAGGRARPDRARAGDLYPDRSGVAHHDIAGAELGASKSLQPASCGERRRLGAGRNPARLAPRRARRAARAAGDAGNGIPGLYPPGR